MGSDRPRRMRPPLNIRKCGALAREPCPVQRPRRTDGHHAPSASALAVAQQSEGVWECPGTGHCVPAGEKATRRSATMAASRPASSLIAVCDSLTRSMMGPSARVEAANVCRVGAHMIQTAKHMECSLESQALSNGRKEQADSRLHGLRSGRGPSVSRIRTQPCVCHAAPSRRRSEPHPPPGAVGQHPAAAAEKQSGRSRLARPSQRLPNMQQAIVLPEGDGSGP